MTASAARERAAAFRALHAGSRILVLPGVWDVASARIFVREGFEAIGISSSAVAWSRGRALAQDAPWSEYLDACRAIARAVDVPVSFDIEGGFGSTPEAICEHVRQAIEAGACGINLEDGVVEGGLRESKLIEEAIRGIRELCAKLDHPLFVNARTDVYLGGIADESRQLHEAIRRGQAFAAAGADGCFVPGIIEAAAIRSVVQEIGVPMNVYAVPGVPSADELAKLGVCRVSLGCGPLQLVLGRTRDLARRLRAKGGWSSFTDGWLEYDEAMAVCAGDPVP